MKNIALIVSGLAIVTALSACVGSKPDSPYPHDVNNSGVWHGEGLDDPPANCTECHGDDLRGTPETPSCYDCHGSQW
jgi:hypothetical protein